MAGGQGWEMEKEGMDGSSVVDPNPNSKESVGFSRIRKSEYEKKVRIRIQTLL
jgi:hypothetical protein